MMGADGAIESIISKLFGSFYLGGASSRFNQTEPEKIN
jgi:hypothetical protein